MRFSGGADTSLLSAGPRARSYRPFRATFPTPSSNLTLVINFTLSFLDGRRRIHDQNHCFNNYTAFLTNDWLFHYFPG